MASNNNIRISKTEDGLYSLSTEAGYIGTVMECQLDSAIQILNDDIYGINFYKKLERTGN